MRIAENIRWAPSYAEALEEARRRRVPLMLKALGQGTTPGQDWCPAGSVTRAFAFSDPDIAALLNEKFVNVKFSMWLWGPDTDAAPRDLVFKLGDIPYPGLLVIDPDENVLGKTIYWATPDASMALLQKVLRDRPDLAGGDPSFQRPFDLDVPAEREIVELQARFKTGDKEARRALVPAFRAWLDQHAQAHPDAAAIARCLLGDSLYCIGEFKQADEMWHEVMRLHPNHAMWNRAWYNLIDKRVWPELAIPDLQPYPLPGGDYRPARVQSPERRDANLHALRHDAKYRRSPSGEAFVEVPAGTFNMGNIKPKFKNEGPRRRVTLTKPYLLSATKVTRAQWAEFRPGDLAPEDLQGLYGQVPMFMVSWHDAMEFVEWKSKRDGWKYRLPTEAEWERAARGGLEDKQYAWGDEPLDATRANWSDPVPVACYAPNGFGLFDMTGNGGEWCSDWYVPTAFSLTPSEVTDPPGPTAEQEKGRNQHVYRGNLIGHEFNTEITYLGWRVGTDSQRKFGCIGFRLAADLP